MDKLMFTLERIKNSHETSSPAKYTCQKCRDTGFVLRNNNGCEEAVECECYEINKANNYLKNSGIAGEFTGKSFENFNTKGNIQLENAKSKAFRYSRDFIETEHTRNNSIMFSGQVGSGKTHLGTAVCRELVGKGVAVIYMPYRNVVTKIKQNITDEEAYSMEIKKYTSARLLFIDDLLKGRITESDINIMYEIVNYRYMNNLPIVISTEKSLDELLAFDEAIGSRIIEMCRGNIIHLQGKELNYRLFS